MTKGYYGGGTWGWPIGPFGVGGGLYWDDRGRLYPQFYFGTPKLSASGGYTDDLEALLTGASVSGTLGRGRIGFNDAANADASGYGIGTPGAGVTYGFGPLEMSQEYSQPWKTPFIRDSARAAGIPNRHNVWQYDYPDSMAIPNAASAPTTNIDNGRAGASLASRASDSAFHSAHPRYPTCRRHPKMLQAAFQDSSLPLQVSSRQLRDQNKLAISNNPPTIKATRIRSVWIPLFR